MSLSPTACGGGPLGQQMLGAVDLRRLGQHSGAALSDEQVAGIAQRRVGGDAGPRIRTAALQRHRQLRHRAGLALGVVDEGQHRLDLGDAHVHRAAQTGHILDVHGRESRPLLEPVGFQQPVDLVHLAAEADHDDAAHVRVAGVAPHHALQCGEAFAGAGHAAAGAVREGDHAVDVRVLGQLLGREVRGDLVRGRGRAVHAGQQADVIARADLPGLAPIAHEGVLHRRHGRRAQVDAELVFDVGGAEFEVVVVDVVASGDVVLGVPDHLRVLAHRLALGDRPRRDLMAARDHRAGRDRFDRLAGLEGTGRGHDVVGLVEAHGNLCRHRGRHHHQIGTVDLLFHPQRRQTADHVRHAAGACGRRPVDPQLRGPTDLRTHRCRCKRRVRRARNLSPTDNIVQ